VRLSVLIWASASTVQVKIQSVEAKWMEAQEKQRDKDDALVGTYLPACLRLTFLVAVFS